MASRSRVSKKDTIVALFDIGTSVVSGALVSMPKDRDTRPVILYTARAPIPVQDTFEFKRFFELVLGALESASAQLALHHDAVPERVYCFLASPWYASQTRTIRYSRPKPFPFTKKFARELIERDLKAFEGTYIKNYTDIGSPVSVIENKIVEIRLNGYKTAMPFDKRAKEIAMHLFFSIGSRALLESIEHVLHRSFRIAPVSFQSFSFASFVVAREIIPESADFLLIDISGEMTDVSIVTAGVLSESVSYPSGKNAVIRDLSVALAIRESEAHSLLRTFLLGKLETKQAARVGKILARALKHWSRQFQESLVQLYNYDRIPHTVVFTADDDVAELFKGALEGEEFSQYMRTAGAFNAILLSYDKLRAFCKVGDEAERDLFLMIETLFISKLAS